MYVEFFGDISANIAMHNAGEGVTQQFKLYSPLTLKGPGGGGGGRSRPPSTFHAIISRKFFSAPQAFMTFSFEVLRNFWRNFRKNRAYCS